MPLCKNTNKRGARSYFTGFENTPRGRGFCAQYEAKGTRMRGADGQMYFVETIQRNGQTEKRWVPVTPEGSRRRNQRYDWSKGKRGEKTSPSVNKANSSGPALDKKGFDEHMLSNDCEGHAKRVQYVERKKAQRKWRDILGVERGAPAAEIKTACKKAALRFHPDKPYGDCDPEGTVMKAVNAACEKLCK